MADVIGYEEKNPHVLGKLESGYPRFTAHRYVRNLVQLVAEEHSLGDRVLLLVASERRAREMVAFAGTGRILRGGEYCGVHFSERETEALQRARSFMQHTGCGLTSREAAGILGLPPYVEERVAVDPGDKIRATLHGIYGTADPGDIYLCRGGMNAFYTAFKILRDEQAAMGRVHWIQLGWLYLDTACILEKMLPVGGRLLHHYDVSNLAALADLLRFYGPAVAGIVTEVPTNPLVQTCDVEALHALARRYGVAVILDPTIASPHNINILHYCDAHINSLTKYASNEADVMMGALALNPGSPFYSVLKQRVAEERDVPPPADVSRLAWTIDSYERTITEVNANTVQVANFLENHPKVDRVWWAYQENSRESYDAISHRGAGPGAIITFALDGPMQPFYDAVPLVKSPSFGARFTMLCPFMYLAHYDLVTDDAGRRLLTRLGLPPDLLRLSVGTEPAHQIIAALRQGFDAME